MPLRVCPIGARGCRPWSLPSRRRAGNKEAVAIVWIDINRFKRVNDQYGHDAGDHVLRTVAERLRRNPLSSGAVARMGEDEFLVVIPGTVDSLDTVEISRRLGAAIAKPIYAGASKIALSTSIGVCLYPQDGANADLLESHADFAMYRAKSSGEPYCIFSPAMSEEAREALEIEERARRRARKELPASCLSAALFPRGRVNGL